MTHVFTELFADHYVALILLAFSWVGVYLVFRSLDALASKLLLRIPFFIWIRFKRRLIGSVAAFDLVRSSADIRPTEVEKLTSMLGDFYSTIDKEFSKIRNGQRGISYLLRDESIRRELRKIAAADWSLLESDFAFCEALSTDPEKSTRGIISFVGNPNITPGDSADLLFYTLRHRPKSLQHRNEIALTNEIAPIDAALFHVGKVIETGQQLQQLQSIVSQLPDSRQEKACEVINEAGDRLSKKGIALAAVAH